MSVRGAATVGKSQLNQDPHLEKKTFLRRIQHISTILETCISNIETAALLRPLLLNSNYRNYVDEELANALEEHRNATDRLEKLEKLEASKPEPVKDQVEDDEEEALRKEELRKEAARKEKARVEQDLKYTFGIVLRLFQIKPNVLETLKTKLNLKVRKTESTLIITLKMYHTHIMKLLTGQDEEPPDAVSALQSLEHLVAQEEVLAVTMKNIDEEFAEHESDIMDYQNYLKSMDEGDDSYSVTSGKNAEAIEAKKKTVQQEIDGMKIRLKALMLENRQAERIIQEKNEMLRKETDKMVKVFDVKMDETQTKLELIEKEYVNELGAVKELEDVTPPLEEKYTKIMEKRRVEGERRKEEMRILALKTRAALIAQSWWRGYKTRMALQKKRKGKKGKGKKGKGKGKGKAKKKK